MPWQTQQSPAVVHQPKSFLQKLPLNKSAVPAWVLFIIATALLANANQAESDETLSAQLGEIALVGYLCSALFLMIHAHAVRADRFHAERARANRILKIGYGLISFIALLLWASSDVAPEWAWAIFTIVLMGTMLYWLVRLWAHVRAQPTKEWSKLPTFQEYRSLLAHHGLQRVQCIHCGSHHIHQFGWEQQHDQKRHHRCQTCNTTLYRTSGTNY